MWLPGASRKTVRRWRRDRHKIDWRGFGLLLWLSRKLFVYLLKGAWLSIKHSRHATRVIASGPRSPHGRSSRDHLPVVRSHHLDPEEALRVQGKTHRGD